MIFTLIFNIVIGIIFTAFVALVFSVLTLLMGKISPDFELAGPEGWTFREFYVRYLIIAAVFTFVSLPLGPLLGLIALAMAYKYVFDAGWIQAVVIGAMGGVVALVLFVFLLVLILHPLGLIEVEQPQNEFDRESLEEFEEQSYYPTAPDAPHGTGAMLVPACVTPPVGG